MKRILCIIVTLLTLVSAAQAEFFTDIIVTSTNGIWTDSRAYVTLNDAITAVGANERTIVIVNEQAVTALTVPSNVTLKFERNGSIANTGQLTINTKNIIADNRQIFTGTGDIDFIPGSVAKTGWFSDIVEAIDQTNDDELTLIVSQAEFVTANCTIGNNVHLKWESPRTRLTANAGVTVDNIGQITAGDYQLFAGAGTFSYRDGVSLNLAWFARLRSAINWIDTAEATLVIPGTNIVDFDETVPANVTLDLTSRRGMFSVPVAITLTINSPANVQARADQQVFDGAGTVRFTRGGTKYPEWWGAIADGATDNSDAINSAIASGSGKVLFLSTSNDYRIASEITVSTQVILEGLGYNTQIRQETSRLNILNITADDVVVKGLHFYTSGVATNTYEDQAVYIYGSFGSNITGVVVEGCYFSNLRRSGVTLRYAENCFIRGNEFLSTVVTVADNHTQSGGDIKLYDSCENNIIEGNSCKSGCGIGIMLQTTQTGNAEVSNGNLVVNNIVADHPVYGIMLYRKDATVEAVEHNIISNNYIYNISGAVQDAAGGYIYGAGIYNQGAEYTTISNNNIIDTHTYADTGVIVETLAPGAIAVASSREVTISGNMIQSPRWFGIYLQDVNGLGVVNGQCVVVGNTISGSVLKSGIKLVDFPMASIVGNTVRGCFLNGLGIYKNLLANAGSHNIVGNRFSNNTNTGIYATNTAELVINGNIVESNGLSGISVSSGVAHISNNKVTGNTSRGIDIAVGVTDGIVSGNYVYGNNYGLNIAGAVRYENNVVEGNTTAAFSGVGNRGVITLANDATPSVKNGYIFVSGGITAITALDDGYDNQIITIKAVHNITITHNANIFLNGAANFNMASNNTLTLMRVNAVWIEIGRKI